MCFRKFREDFDSILILFYICYLIYFEKILLILGLWIIYNINLWIKFIFYDIEIFKGMYIYYEFRIILCLNY